MTSIRIIKADQLTPDLVAAWSEIQRGNRCLASPFFRPEFTQAVASVARPAGSRRLGRRRSFAWVLSLPAAAIRRRRPGGWAAFRFPRRHRGGGLHMERRELLRLVDCGSGIFITWSASRPLIGIASKWNRRPT